MVCWKSRLSTVDNTWCKSTTVHMTSTRFFLWLIRRHDFDLKTRLQSPVMTPAAYHSRHVSVFKEPEAGLSRGRGTLLESTRHREREMERRILTGYTTVGTDFARRSSKTSMARPSESKVQPEYNTIQYDTA